MAKYELDCLNEICPVPLVKTEKKIKELEIGDTLIVSINHSCALKNVPEWARKNNHIVKIEKSNGGEWEILINKSA